MPTGDRLAVYRHCSDFGVVPHKSVTINYKLCMRGRVRDILLGTSPSMARNRIQSCSK